MSRTAPLRAPLRKTVKWGGLVASASFLALFLLSVLWSLYWCGRGSGVLVIAQGTISVGWLDQQKTAYFPPEIRLGGPGRSITDYPPALQVWYWEFKWDQNGVYGIGVPLWLPLLLAAAITAFAFRADLLARRRARIGKCIACGYPLDGLPPESPCPECGRTPKAQSAAAPRTEDQTHGSPSPPR